MSMEVHRDTAVLPSDTERRPEYMYWVAAGLSTLSLAAGTSQSQAEAAGNLRPNLMTPAVQELGREATAQVVWGRQTIFGQKWSRGCTATRIEAKDPETGKITDNVFETSRHCVVNQAGLENATFYGGAQAEAFNIFHLLKKPMAISDPGNPRKPFARVTDVAVLVGGYPDRDYALLRTSQVKSVRAKMSAIKPIPLRTILSSNKRTPAKNEVVSMYGSSVLNKKPITQTGTYLERVHFRGQNFDVVGLKSKIAKKDPCFGGKSGSSFITATGLVSGPLAQRISPADAKTYRRNNLQLPDGYTYQSFKSSHINSRRDLQLVMDTSIKLWKRICLFEEREKNAAQLTMEGFNNPLLSRDYKIDNSM